MSLKRKRALSPCSDYTLFTGAPTRGELQGWLDGSSHPPPPPLLWEKISSSITFPRRPSSLPPPVASIARASQTDSISSSSSQRSLRPPSTSQPQRTSSSLPPPPGPTPSPQKLTLTVAPTPSPGSSTGVAGSLGESMEVSGPPSGRKGTRNRGPEWTPILTPPSFEDPATKKKKAAVGAGRALVGKGAKGLLSLVAEEEEAEAEGGGGREEEGREEKGDTTVATEISFLAPSPFFAPSRASRSREEEDEDDDDRGEEGPSRSRPSADFSLQDEFIDESTRPPPGYENVLTQPDASDVTRSRFEDPDETGSSLEESQIPMKRKGKGRGSVLALNPTQSRSTRSHPLLNNNTSLAADLTTTSAAAAGDESQDSFGSSYLQTQNDLPTQTTTAAPPLPYVHPKINTSHLTHLDSDDLTTSSSSSSQLPSRINFLAVVLGVELDTIPAKDGRFWTLGKVKVHDGRKERVVQCWEEVAREWCEGVGSGRGRLRRLDVVWFQNIKPDLERPSKTKKRNETDPSVILKADFSPSGSPSSFEVFYRCSEFSPHDAPEDTVRWRVNLGRKDRGVEMVKKLVRLVEVGTFGS
ncbi:hypothetical protein BDY24DRAFT_12940 [Mrakia frigida]|uniref:uncharacterized protein n=1 Tax=Mrakia frigida TaxID=29902 RepID=UPI003FCBF870